MAEKIPRRIIQVWGKSAEMPLLAKASAANLCLLNPSFEYLFFDDTGIDKFIDCECPQYRPLFASIPAKIQRYDLFRYLSVYYLGGFYFDTDVLLASSLENLLEFGCVFPFEHLSFHRFLCKEYGMDWEIGNYAFGATAGHPFLGAIIKNCVRAQQYPEWVEAMTKSIPRMFRAEYFVLNSTGPGLVSRTLAEYPGASEQVKVLFPEDVRDQNSWYCFGEHGVHLQVGTWRTREPLVRRVLHRHWKAWTQKALLKESLKRGGKRALEFGVHQDSRVFTP
jgi:inositol phosphorylceramide mannosyltransferase catalytic subunit